MDSSRGSGTGTETCSCSATKPRAARVKSFLSRMHRTSASASFLCILLLFCTGSAQEKQSKKSNQKEFIKRCATMKLDGPFLDFKDVTMQAGERYRAPLVRYQINEDGTVSNVMVLRYSGVKDIDQQLASAVSNLK